MEQLLLLLFLVFSVVSALLERRKRKQQLEEAQARQKERQDAGEVTAPVVDQDVDQEEDEEEWGGWPFPSADPFEPQKKPVRKQAEMPTTAEGQILLQDLERQAAEAERQAELQASVARTYEQKARKVQPAQRVTKLLRDRQQKLAGGPVAKRPPGRYKLSPAKTREAIVWAEILGPCKGEQQEEWRW